MPAGASGHPLKAIQRRRAARRIAYSLLRYGVNEPVSSDKRREAYVLVGPSSEDEHEEQEERQKNEPPGEYQDVFPQPDDPEHHESDESDEHSKDKPHEHDKHCNDEHLGSTHTRSQSPPTQSTQSTQFGFDGEANANGSDASPPSSYHEARVELSPEDSSNYYDARASGFITSSQSSIDWSLREPSAHQTPRDLQRRRA
ncbi:unnamed protein product [Parajaminaea phylloscopi]